MHPSTGPGCQQHVSLTVSEHRTVDARTKHTHVYDGEEEACCGDVDNAAESSNEILQVRPDIKKQDEGKTKTNEPQWVLQDKKYNRRQRTVVLQRRRGGG
jgi:hypothetical protein